MTNISRLLCAMALVTTASAADRYVWKDAPFSGPPYGSWDTAATSVHDAVQAAADGETVWVTNGTYDVTGQVVIVRAVAVRSTEGRDATTLRRATTNEFRLLVLSNSSAVIDGFTLTNGYGRADSPGRDSFGGAIRLFGGTVQNCRVVGSTCRGGAVGEAPNGVSAFGGAIHMSSGRVENCEIRNNTSSGSGGSSSAYGGGIECSGGAIADCRIEGNAALGTGNGAGYGGGMRIAGPAVLSGSQIVGNRVSAANNVAASYGAGIYMVGNGLVSNCVIALNRCIFWQSLGGGVYMTTGTVTHCTLVSNRCESSHTYLTSQESGGAGAYLLGGTLRNCVIARNRATHTGQIRDRATRGAGVLMEGSGLVENCTISRNVVDASGRGDGLYMTAGQVWNCIVHGNFNDAVTNYTANHENVFQAGGVLGYSCAPLSTIPNGVSNLVSDPGFAAPSANDFSLLPGSSCIDSATNRPSVGTDRGGTARPRDGDGDGDARPDMGCWEAPPLDEGPFRANFTLSPEDSFAPAAIVLTAHAGGTNQTGLSCSWDFTSDGTVDQSGPTAATTYAEPGYYTVSLTIINDALESAAVVKTGAVRVFAPVVYAAPQGAGAFPFDTPARATSNLQAAVDAAAPGASVLIAAGSYAVDTPLILRRAVTVSSTNGPAETAIERRSAANTRLLLVTHSNAVVERLTLRNGSWQSSGMAFGGAVWMTAGLVRDCVIASNLVRGLPNQTGAGGGVFMSAGTLRNCLLLRNESRSDNSTGHGGGVFMSGGLVENCTVVSNYAWRADASGSNDATRGGGVRLEGGGMTNSIVTRNGIRVAASTGVQISIVGATNIGFSCSPELVHSPSLTGNITNGPSFAEGSDGYRLAPVSPCVNAGRDLPWMPGARDLDGRPRSSGGRPDMGAYELWMRPKTIIQVR